MTPSPRAIFDDLVWRFRRLDPTVLRWSFLIDGVLVLIGIGVNFAMPHGWTVWPFVAIAGVLVMLNESTDRNGEGIPPLRVYGLFFAGLTLYIVALMILSTLNLFVVLAGMAMCLYFAMKAYLDQRAKDRLLAERLANGLCIHCGHPRNPDLPYCTQCGEEPDPSAAQRERIRAVVVSNQASERMRSILSTKNKMADLQKKERALLGHRSRPSGRRLM